MDNLTININQTVESLSLRITNQVNSYSVNINSNMVDLTPYALSTHTHGGLSLFNMSGTSASNGLTLSAGTAGGGGAALQGSGTYTQNSGTIKFETGNGITFGLTNNVMTASHNALTTAMASNAGSNFMGVVTAGTNVSLTANSSGLSLSIPNYLTTAQPVGAYLTTAQPVGAYLTTAMASENTSLFQYTSGTSAITSLAMNTSERANYFYTSNNTFANSTHSHGNPTLNLTNLSGTTASASNGLTLSLSAPAEGTLYFGNSNGVTFGTSINGVSTSVTASVNVAGGAQTAISGLGASDSTYTSGTVIMSGQNNITIGTSVNGASQYIRFSVGAYLTTAMLSENTSVFQYSSNTSAITSNAMNTSERAGLQYTSAMTKFAGILTTGVTGASATINSSQIQINLPAYLTTAAQVSQVVNSINGSTGAFSFATGSSLSSSVNGSTITFGLASNITTALMPLSYSSGFQTATLSTALMPLAYSSGFQTATLSTALMPLGYSSGFQTGTLSTALMPLGYSTKYAGLNTSTASVAGSDMAMTLNTSGLTLGIPKWLTTAAGGGGVAIAGSAASTVTNGTLQFANSNNISFGLNGSTMTGSVDAGSLFFGNTNGISFGTSTNGVSTSVTASILNVSAGIAGIAGSAASSVTNGSVVFANLNGVSFGLNGSTMTASYNSAHTHGNPTLALTGLLGSTASASNGLTISLSNPEYTLSEYMPFDISPVTNNSSLFGNSSIYLVPFTLPESLYADRLNLFGSIAYTSSNASSISMRISYQAGLYTRGAGTNSTRIENIWSKEAYFSVYAEPTSVSVEHPNGFAAGNVAYSTYQGASANSSQTAYLRDSVGGLRAWALPIGSTLTPGQYWFGFGIKSAHGTGTASWNFRISHHYQSLTMPGYVRWAQQSVASNATGARPAWQGGGSFSAQSAALPTPIALNATDIKFGTSIAWPMFNFSGFVTDASNL